MLMAVMIIDEFKVYTEERFTMVNLTDRQAKQVFSLRMGPGLTTWTYCSSKFVPIDFNTRDIKPFTRRLQHGNFLMKLYHNTTHYRRITNRDI